MNENDFMHRAIELAQRGCGWVAPNPMVGAVLVKDGRVIGQGWHRKFGGLHAEREALASCTESPQGATMYVTLEPCCHHGKQPPCVDAILQAGIAHVAVGSVDPNPLVKGKGIRMLREHGVRVTEHVLQEECDRLNEVFFHYIRTGLPFVVMKYAMTMDGKIAAYTGASKWITGEEARMHVQQQRHRYRAIMVGTGTVQADDPLLTCRIKDGKNPVRILCDSGLRIPLDARVIATAREIPTILATCNYDKKKAAAYEQAGCYILRTASQNGQVDLQDLMRQLGDGGIDSVLLEGGGTLNWSAMKNGIVNKVQAYIAPKLLGGREAKTPAEGQGFSSLEEAVRLKNSKIIRLGADILMESEVDTDVYGNR